MGDAAEKLEPEFLTVEEAAELLRLHPRTIYDYVKANNPVWAMRIGRIIRIDRARMLFQHGPTPTKRSRR